MPEYAGNWNYVWGNLTQVYRGGQLVYEARYDAFGNGALTALGAVGVAPGPGKWVMIGGRMTVFWEKGSRSSPMPASGLFFLAVPSVLLWGEEMPSPLLLPQPDQWWLTVFALQTFGRRRA